MKKLFIIIAVFLGAVIAFIAFLSKKPSNHTQEFKWGITFSKYFAQKSALDWQDVYLDILDELKPEYIRIAVYWQDIEPEPGHYVFDDYDWMVEEAAKRNIKIIFVLGRKVPRWPECHVPNWAHDLDESIQQSKILDSIEITIEHFKHKPGIYAWQIENEPFLPFGECPKLDVDFLDKEINLVKKLDASRPIMITDSGELSIWLKAAKRADIFGTTMYRIVWNDYIGYYKYPLPPKFFWIKANFVHLFYPQKPIVVCELQGEYWGPRQPYETPYSEEMKSMSFSQFQENINYAKEVGFEEIYLWGAEWWYWLREKHGDDRFWEEAKRVMNENR